MKRVSFATRLCSRCGKPLHDEANFCPWCGQKAVDENDPQIEMEEMDPEWRPVFRKRQTSAITSADDSWHGVNSDEKIGPTRMLPEPLSYTYPTKGFVFRAPQPSKAKSFKSKEDENDEGGPIRSFHALEHALIESSDSITGSGSSEIGGVSIDDMSVIFVYGGSPGGSGLTTLLYDKLDEALSGALAILKECKCTSTDGCPLCTYSYQCGNNNEPLNKLGAIDSLEQILKGSSSKIKENKFPEHKTYL